MTAQNTQYSFGWVTKTFHWLTALLVITAIILGVTASRWGFDSQSAIETKVWLFSFHKTIGITAFTVAILRILWALTQTRPGLLNADEKSEAFLAETVHWLLYASLVLVPLTGWISHAATQGFAPIWWPFGQDLPFVPKSQEVFEITSMLHRFWEKILLVAILLHVAGAFKHHLIDKDATLRRMWFGKSESQATPHHHAILPPILAVLIFGGVAAYAGAKIVSEDAGDALAELIAEPSPWEKQGGSIDLTITQFGNKIEGEFSDWTSQITFEPNTTTGVAGSVFVSINTASLTLGSVTDQAKGAGFFETASFPQAIYEGPILLKDGAYSVDGMLTIKDIPHPLTLPFDLSLDGELATASGTIEVMRLNYGIGDTVPDEGTLGHGVDISITITAQRQ